ncbi:alpha/beta fold hydrolase [Nocardioides perillae]|uniref:Pimeloyl-ACP methyl ester carboxylesterase n=1 Tax=Nocardioides perillae TaxID=1119534 RepID=A0A7Y9UK01_9ACTN|nr:pimeloyl-ACP methyl ester carboxylesterase [Nocardioides perillae]
MKTFDGLELHVRTHGPDDAPLTVALAHCWTADTEDWHYQVRDLLSAFGHEVRIVTWDHRGHGRSQESPLEACTIENLARDMGDVLDRYAPTGRLVLAGHSIGGMTMMALAEQRPDLLARVDGALFVSTSCGDLRTVTLGLPEMGPVKEAIPHVLAVRARLLSRTQRRRFPLIERQVVRRVLFGSPLRPRDTGLVVDQLINCPPATMEGFYRDCMLHDRHALLGAYDHVPTRVLVGSADRLTPPHHARKLAAAIAGARLVVAPGAGHMLPLEREALVSEHLVELVADAQAAARARRTAAPTPAAAPAATPAATPAAM